MFVFSIMEVDLLCCLFDNLDFATISQGQSPISLIEVDFLCNTFKGLNLDDGVHNSVQTSESIALDGFTHCQASIICKVPSFMSRVFNSSLEIESQTRFTFSGKFHSVIPIGGVYVDGDGVSNDLNLNLSDEIDGTLQTRWRSCMMGTMKAWVRIKKMISFLIIMVEFSISYHSFNFSSDRIRPLLVLS
ncbi:uncharacterized protein LOC113317447 [Papaver somniferum]|uniref:uncharacterized protein LOC113317447 n=1 Tax=Papaver somniferum TaxID=3469 RepID=UPI000E6FD856|nr:uncharacterized protein LOC113317447 [Papaver somniferum]